MQSLIIAFPFRFRYNLQTEFITFEGAQHADQNIEVYQK